MRVKRPVDFRMAPKKAIKGKGVAAEPTQEEGWNTSKCSQSDLVSLVNQGLLAPGSVVQWRPALGKDHPYENTGEIVAFTSYLERGLGFPCSSFFFGLLRYYRIQLHHLTPNSLVQDPASSLDPQFPCSYFYLRAFVQSFSGHRASF